MKPKDILDRKMLVPTAVGIVIVIIILVLFFSGFFEPKIPAKELSPIFESLDKGAAFSDVRVLQFDSIKDIEIENLSPKEVVKMMNDTATIEEFTDEGISGALSVLDNYSAGIKLKLMALKFNDNFSAEKYFIATESKLAKEYPFEERLKYEEISSRFSTNLENSLTQICLLKKGSYLIICEYDKYGS